MLRVRSTDKRRIGGEDMYSYDTNPALIEDLLPEAMFPEGWAWHYQNGICDVCPACGHRALVTATVADDEHDEVYEQGRGCDFCGYKEEY